MSIRLNLQLDSFDLDEFSVLVLYKFRCIRCNKTASTIHEKIPKSLAPHTWRTMKNRVLLCAECHDWAHKVGTRTSEEELTELQRKRLKSYYGYKLR